MRAINAGINITPKSQREELILYFTLVPGTPMLDPLILERKIYASFIHPSTLSSTAGRGKQAGNKHRQKGKKNRKEGDFVTRDLFRWEL